MTSTYAPEPSVGDNRCTWSYYSPELYIFVLDNPSSSLAIQTIVAELKREGINRADIIRIMLTSVVYNVTCSVPYSYSMCSTISKYTCCQNRLTLNNIHLIRDSGDMVRINIIMFMIWCLFEKKN